MARLEQGERPDPMEIAREIWNATRGKEDVPVGWAELRRMICEREGWRSEEMQLAHSEEGGYVTREDLVRWIYSRLKDSFLVAAVEDAS